MNLIKNARVFIRLEDTTYQDDKSTIVLEKIIENFEYDSQNERKNIRFMLEDYLTIDEHATYNVSVLVDVDRDGQISLGDYVSTESYPVITHGYGNNIQVKVKQVQ